MDDTSTKYVPALLSIWCGDVRLPVTVVHPGVPDVSAVVIGCRMHPRSG
jgi:hypothetical protein